MPPTSEPFFVARCPEHGFVWDDKVQMRVCPQCQTATERVEVVSVADLLSDPSIERAARRLEFYECGGMEDNMREVVDDLKPAARSFLLAALGSEEDVSR